MRYPTLIPICFFYLPIESSECHPLKLAFVTRIKCFVIRSGAALTRLVGVPNNEEFSQLLCQERPGSYSVQEAI